MRRLAERACLAEGVRADPADRGAAAEDLAAYTRLERRARRPGQPGSGGDRRSWALTSRFAVTDDAGVPQLEVHGRFALTRKLSVCDIGGTEIAVISRRGLTMRYQILAGGQETTVRPRGFFGRRFEIDSLAGREARGNFSGRQYTITRGGMLTAGVRQLRTPREQFAVEVADGEDVVLMLAVLLVIEIIRDDRRRSAGG